MTFVFSQLAGTYNKNLQLICNRRPPRN